MLRLEEPLLFVCEIECEYMNIYIYIYIFSDGLCD